MSYGNHGPPVMLRSGVMARDTNAPIGCEYCAICRGYHRPEWHRPEWRACRLAIATERRDDGPLADLVIYTRGPVTS